jgi:putative thioredoxin
MSIDATPATFATDVVEASRTRPVLVDFWAPWCQPCRVVGPVLEELEREDGGRWTLVKVNVQDHPELGDRFGISGIPAMKLFTDGAVAAELRGALPKPQLRRWLDQAVPGEERALTEAGRAALAADDHEGAIARFQQALAARPGHPPARAGLARALARSGRPEEARPLVGDLSGSDGAMARLEVEMASADPTADGVAGRYGRALARFADGGTEEALEELLGIVQTDRAFGEDAARKRLLDVLEAVGDPQLTEKWRRRLAQVLF